LVKIEGPVWYTYHHFPVVKRVSSNPSINQPMGKGHLCHITFVIPIHVPCKSMQLFVEVRRIWEVDGFVTAPSVMNMGLFSQGRILKVTFRLGIGFLE